MRRNPARTIAWSSTIATRTTFTPLTPTLSPVGRGGALRGSRRGLLSRASPQPSPLWGEGERCAQTDSDYFHAPHPNPLPCGERRSVARKATRTTFTPPTPTLSPVGRGGALRGTRLRRGLLSRPSPQPSPLWGEGERCADREASQGRRPRAELTAEELDALAHSDQAVAGSWSRCRTAAVVADRQLKCVGRVIDQHLDPVGVRVLEHVRDRLLDDPVSGEIDRGW